MTSTQTTTAKMAAVVAIVSLAAMALYIMPARAQTTTTTTTTTVSGTPFLRSLTMGSTGSDVTALQTWLIGTGFSIPAGATGFFWTQTRAAVASFQSVHGIVPPVGYFGPITRGVVNAVLGGTTNGNLPPGCITTSGYSPITGVLCSSGGSTGGTTGGLQGSGGRLDSISTLGDIQSSLNENTGDMKVVGISARAIGSDLAVDRVDVQFDLSNSAGSTNLNRYVQSVSIYQNGTKLATMNPADGSYQNKVWSLRFNNLNGIIRNGQTSNLYIEVTPVSSINSNEMNQNVKVTIPSNGIRVVDSRGVSDTYPANSVTQTFSVAAATSGKLIISQANDNPLATVVKGDTNNSTTNVTLESFNLKANNQNLLVRSIPVSLSVTGTST